MNKYAVIILTKEPSELIECFASLEKYFNKKHIVFSVYGENTPEVLNVISALASRYNFQYVACEDGWADKNEALNAAMPEALKSDPQNIVVVSDTARIGTEFVDEFITCMGSRASHAPSGDIVWRQGKVGIVGPCTDQTRAVSQRLTLTEQDTTLGLQGYCDARLVHFAGGVSISEWIDDLMFMVSSEAAKSLIEQYGEFVDDHTGRFAFQDLSIRLRDKGYECAVSEAVFVANTSAVPYGHQTPGDFTERFCFYAKYEPPVDPKIASAIRVNISSVIDLVMAKDCIAGACRYSEVVAVLLVSNPASVLSADDYNKRRNTLSTADRKLIQSCDGSNDARKVEKAFSNWVSSVVSSTSNAQVEAVVKAYVGPPTDREHVRALSELCEKAGADAILTLDHDELVEDRITPTVIKRIVSHPNPMVQAWDVGFFYHWDAQTLVREDEPYGHGGQYMKGPHGVRLWRKLNGKFRVCTNSAAAQKPCFSPDFGPEAQRVANLRVRRFTLMREEDRKKAALKGSEEGLRLSRYNPNTGLGLHMLCYEKELVEDIARWMDDLHSVIDKPALVWTGEWRDSDKGWSLDLASIGTLQNWPETGPPRMFAVIAKIHGVSWVHQELNDDLATARNAGINFLTEEGGLGFAMFLDPDEWLINPNKDCVSIRNMVHSDRYGYLFQAANYRNDSREPTISDSIRISRIDEEGSMRMNGRVHEGFQKSIEAIQAKGVHPRMRYAPFILQHRGLSFSTERMDEKLQKYENLLRLQLEEDPTDAGSWVSLGWHYFNDGHNSLGVECYKRAVDCAGMSYLPFKEMGYHHLRLAKKLFGMCEERLSDAHQFAKLCTNMNDWLQTYAPEPPIIERPVNREPLELPEYNYMNKD